MARQQGCSSFAGLVCGVGTMAVLGLDIGSDTIKVVEMAGGRGRLKLLNYGIAPTPPGAVANGDIADVEQIGEAVRGLLKNRRIKTNKVVTSVQGQQSVVVRIIKVHRVSKSELEENMKFEVERHIPFSASSFIMDYVPIERPGESPDSPSMEVLFAAAVDSMIEDHFAALRSAKLQPKAIDVQPLALSHSLVEGHDLAGGREQTIALVNIGANSTDLGVIKDGQLHFPRSIPIGGRSITQRLSEGLGVSEQQAERLKRQYGSMRALPPELAARLARALEPEPSDVPTMPALDFGSDLFDLDPEDSSDMGFAGMAGGLSFGDAGGGDEPPEVRFDDGPDDVSPLTLDSPAPAAGGAFDFGLETPTAAEAGPPDVQFDEGTFDFGDQADLPKVGSVGAQEPNADETTFEFAFADDGAAKAEAGPDTTFAFELADDDAGEGFSFDLAEDPAKSPAAAVPPKADAPVAEDSFNFDFGGDEAAPAATAPSTGAEASADETFMFDFGESEPASTSPASTSPSAASASAVSGSAVGASDVGPDSSFDFQFDVPDAGSSMAAGEPAKVDAATATDVGSSYDLGFLASDEGAGATGESLDLAFSSAPGPVPAEAGATGDDLEMLSPEDEERLRVREVMEPVVRDLAQEVARSLEYYQSQYEGAVVDKVVLVGGSARIEGLAEFFEAELGLTVEEGRPLEGIALSPKLPAEDLDRDEPVLAVAVGLAMRGLM